MKQLSILPFAACLIAGSLQAQDLKSSDGIATRDRSLKSVVRPAWDFVGFRGTAPANDECSGAETVPVSATCIPVSGTLEGATQSMPAAVCSNWTSATAMDVWYTFTAVGAATTIIVTGGAGTTTPDTTGMDPVFEVFSGTCAGLTSIGCVDETLPGGSTELLEFPTTAGATYYYRIYYWDYGVLPTNYSFTTCVFEWPQPVNDDCASAIPLIANASCVYTGFDTEGATYSNSTPTTQCDGFGGNPNDDVWFSFVATSPNMTVGAQGFDDGDGNVFTGYNAVINVFDVCGGNLLGCADATTQSGAEHVDLTGLTAGNTYFFRVYDYFTADPSLPWVNVCVVDGSLSIGVAENGGLTNSMRIHPTPTSEAVTITLNTFDAGTISVIDISGATVLTKLVFGGSIRMDLSSLATGMYTARYTATNGSIINSRIIKL